MDGIAGGVVRLARALQVGLQLAQAGHGRLEIGLGLLDGQRVLHAVAIGLALLQQPQEALLLFAFRLESLVALGDLGLRLELFELGGQFAQDVLDPGHVLARVGQAVLGLAAALLVARHARGLFQEHAQFVGPGLDDARDHALADDGVAARAQAGAQEDVMDVAATDLLVVDEIAAGAVAGQYPLDGDLAVLAPLPGRPALGIVEHQFDRGPRRRLAVDRAVEDHVLHGLAAQLGGLGFTQDPAHGIDDVGLSAAIGTHHADQLARHLDGRGVDERLETCEFDLGKSHRKRSFA